VFTLDGAKARISGHSVAICHDAPLPAAGKPDEIPKLKSKIAKTIKVTPALSQNTGA